MKVNTKVRYGLRAMLRMAEGYGGGPVPVSSIAQHEGISAKYLEQVVVLLRRRGLIKGHKGVRGGYTLTRPPAEITLWEVIAALDTGTMLVKCVDVPEACERSAECQTRQMWTILSQRLRDFWSGMTLEDLNNRLSEHPLLGTARARKR
jgi:Rrf2 family protein